MSQRICPYCQTRGRSFYFCFRVNFISFCVICFRGLESFGVNFIHFFSARVIFELRKQIRRYFWRKKKQSHTSADGKKRGKRWRAELLHGSPRSLWQRVKISGQWYWGSVYGGSRPASDLAFWIWPILQRSKLQSKRAAGFHPNLLYKLTFRWEPIW